MLPPNSTSTPPQPAPTWLRSLRHRPLLWLAPALASGCALGALVSVATSEKRDTPLLPMLAILAGFAALSAWMLARRSRGDMARTCLAFGFMLWGAAQTAYRLAPPPGDVSRLVRNLPIPAGPQARVPVSLEGWVADDVQRGDFGIEFPLECQRITVNGQRASLTGCVWIQAPLDAPATVGDVMALNADLADLPRAGNPGEHTSPLPWIIEGCWCQAKVKKTENIRIVRAGAYAPLARWIVGVRQRLVQHYETAFGSTSTSGTSEPVRAYPRATAQLLAAMVFGEGGLQEPLPPLVRDEFRAAGLSHVLVASGTQVSFLALFVLGGARLVGLRRWPLVLLVACVLGFFALLAGGAASIWRAVIGGLCVAFALLLGRDIDGLSLWSLALIVLLLLDPAQGWSLSFQLTFGATWGLLALAPALRCPLDKLIGTQAGMKPLRELVCLSLGAQLATLPLVLFHFGRLSAAGLGANLLAVPLAGVLVGTGVLGLVLPFANLLNYALTRAMLGIASFAASAPGARIETVPVRLGSTLLLYGILCLAAFGPAHGLDWHIARDEWRRWRERQIARRVEWRPHPTLAVLAAIAAAIWVWHVFQTGAGQLSVTILDVGQGESIVVHSPDGHTVLIDGGTLSPAERGDVGRSVIVPYLQHLGVSHLDALVMTHADSDHCNALPAVLREVPVDMALDGSLQSGPEPNPLELDHAQVRQMLQTRGVPVYAAHPGQKLNLGEGVTLSVLAPIEPPLKGDNNNAAVLRLDYGATSVLLTADIEREAEERLVRRGADLHCTVLKVAHHGSGTSTSPLLLRAANPKAAVISCGRYNPFGHPAPATLEHLATRHIPVFRTDVNGAIEIYSDGRACWIQTFR